MRDINSMNRGNALTLNRRNSVPSQLGLPDKGRAIEGLVVCINRDLEPLDLQNVLINRISMNRDEKYNKLQE